MLNNHDREILFETERRLLRVSSRAHDPSVQGSAGSPGAITIGPDLALALARWENEGGRWIPRAAAGTDTDSGESSSPKMPRPRVRVGRVYDARTAEDGTRVLVDRLWPRGLTRSRADLDEWCKQIAPSAALRRWYGHDPTRFAEFGRRYRSELADPERAAALQHLRELAQQRPMALLTATREVENSEAAVLADLLVAGSTTN
ncbi:DUF488 domain-containing protein [Pseudonocardia halophobica]|uniref:DUF488 domain-containing protein n=1 Tax=Pseudonocardia halophobica TaxID=29401 RepID=UPI003D8E4102